MYYINTCVFPHNSIAVVIIAARGRRIAKRHTAILFAVFGSTLRTNRKKAVDQPNNKSKSTVYICLEIRVQDGDCKVATDIFPTHIYAMILSACYVTP